MSRTSICFEMLQMLNTGRTIKISEFAKHFETSSRNIIEYRKELELAGYTIIVIPGRYGGYKLDRTSLFPSLKLTDSEKKALLDSYSFVCTKKDLMHKDELDKAMSKILSSIDTEINDDELIAINKYQLTMTQDEVQKRYSFIENAIENNSEIEIEYNSIKNGLKKHVLHPYKLFLYNNTWFFLCLNTEVGEIWQFKLNRIQSYKLTKKKFIVWKNFDANKYFDEHGLKDNGEFYHIELIATKKRVMLMKERVYGKNQNIVELDDNSVKVSLDMQNKELIISYILQCGTEIEVLEPAWLIDEVTKLCELIIAKYKK